MAFNAHKVFTDSNGTDYLVALTVEEDREIELREARDSVRGTLKAAFQSWGSFLETGALFEVASAAKSSLTPKFRMQGSFAYRTLNEPAQDPQEIDLDDGMFLPISYLADSGGSHPALISDGYFELVEGALLPLCDKMGWVLETDLPSCVRVRLNSDAHLDIALYAIPDEEFEVLVEKALRDDLVTAAADSSLDDGLEFSETIYRSLDPNQIMLAHRDEKWKPSDPRKLDDWFRQGIELHGAQFRRICRYLKGWRDNRWKESRLSSIALMACARDAFDADRTIAQKRDDLRLLDVAQRLPKALEARIKNPVVDGQFLDEKWSVDQRKDYVQAARDLATQIEDALFGGQTKQHVVELLTSAFGPRIPTDISFIVSDDPPPSGGISSPQILSSGILGDMAARVKEREPVRKDGDGRYG